MQELRNALFRFRDATEGVTSIEYAVIIALVSGTLLFALPGLSDGISNPLSQLTAAFDGDSGDGGGGDGDGGDGDGGDGDGGDGDGGDGDGGDGDGGDGGDGGGDDD